jgi:hypothetical protein
MKLDYFSFGVGWLICSFCQPIVELIYNYLYKKYLVRINE